MYYIDFKVTTWNRIYIPDKSVRKIKDALKKGNIENESDVYNIDDDCEYEHLFEVDTPITLKENKGISTIEAYNEDGKQIYKNGK